ncbi:hypothetical protein EVG20_g4571 [Dentipellis fragilis]|uniref:Hyaluronan/mRNA-binding protein domain-containing protein n=1 Tax=Dentipellis fragilis TaxID=205917 RepID=A0A4Y9YWD2_9AGAM|nr:hypothetical protein EVG20_g4571 [Dentipellis fragilis]
MTRTERATSPRALLKDRSEAKNGMDASIRKGGAGAHNWGSLDDEARLEDEADLDEEQAFQEDNSRPADTGATKRPDVERKNSITDEDREKALNVRKNALKGNNVDLSAIARTSMAVSSSPPKEAPIATGTSSPQ